MIVEYNLREKRVTIVGGGHETARKIRAFVQAGARVRLLGPRFDGEALATAKELGALFRYCPPSQIARRAFASTDILVVVADDPALGRELRPIATRRRIPFYVCNDAEVSDWVQPALRRIGPIVLAVSTGGRSPIVARELAGRLARAVHPEDEHTVAVQAFAREMVRKWIPQAGVRHRLLYDIYRDGGVRAALAEGNLRAAKARARRMVQEATGRRRLLRGTSHPRRPCGDLRKVNAHACKPASSSPPR